MHYAFIKTTIIYTLIVFNHCLRKLRRDKNYGDKNVFS